MKKTFTLLAAAVAVLATLVEDQLLERILPPGSGVLDEIDDPESAAVDLVTNAQVENLRRAVVAPDRQSDLPDAPLDLQIQLEAPGLEKNRLPAPGEAIR